MPFTTLTFIGFFAALFFAYYAIPKRFQWWLLLAGSMVFYGHASPFYLLLLWATILVSYAGTLAIGNVYARRDAYLKSRKQDMSRDEKRAYKETAQRLAKLWLAGLLVVLLAMLGIFKYAQFAIDNLLTVLGWVGCFSKSDIALNIILPVGLSFYLFQTIGYCIDVYREEVHPERNLFKHALFVSFFPQLLQGPIGNYGRLAPQLLATHTFDYQQSVFGIQRVAWGMFKKLMIANPIASRIGCCWTAPDEYTGALCWVLVLFLYAVQIYADFSGYMDIAYGCSQMLGIKLDENFNLPYFSRNIPEFWRRWHMTLSSWFRDYLFYPLMRSSWCSAIRKSFARAPYLAQTIPTSAALLVVWSTTGLWHGASWGYIAWGAYYGLLMILNLLLQPVFKSVDAAIRSSAVLRLKTIWNVLVTFSLVVFGYSLFKPHSLSDSFYIWQQLLNVSDLQGLKPLSLSGQWSLKWSLVWTMVLLAVDLWHIGRPEGDLRRSIRRQNPVLRYAIYLVALLVLVYNADFFPGVVEFEYFKF